MGELREVRALHAYIGPEGYRFFRRIYSGVPMMAGEFIATQRSVNVDFVPLGELTPPDRDLLKVVGLPFKRGTLAPIFRASRPGYHPWYVTEGEARILAECQRALITLCDLLKTNPNLGYWDKQSVYPLLARRAEEGNAEEFQIRLIDAPSFPLPMPNLATLDEANLQRIRGSRYPLQGVLEVDHFYGMGMIGEKHQRKACIRMALAIDAKSGFAYPPEVSSPDAPTADVLARVVLRAIDSSGTMPREIHVRSGEFKALLKPLAQALGFSVRAKESLPALDFAKNHLLEMMGDPGQLPSF
jgi:hypothetical protein